MTPSYAHNLFLGGGCRFSNCVLSRRDPLKMRHGVASISDEARYQDITCLAHSEVRFYLFDVLMEYPCGVWGAHLFRPAPAEASRKESEVNATIPAIDQTKHASLLPDVALILQMHYSTTPSYYDATP